MVTYDFVPVIVILRRSFLAGLILEAGLQTILFLFFENQFFYGGLFLCVAALVALTEAPVRRPGIGDDHDLPQYRTTFRTETFVLRVLESLALTSVFQIFLIVLLVLNSSLSGAVFAEDPGGLPAILIGYPIIFLIFYWIAFLSRRSYWHPKKSK